MNTQSTVPGRPDDPDARRLKRGLEALTQPGSAPLTQSLLADIRSRAAHRKRRRAVAAAGWFSLAAAVITVVFIVGAHMARPDADPDHLAVEGEVENEVAGRAPDGFRLEAYGDVFIAIPVDWETGSAPQPDHCRQPAPPRRPYIDLEYESDPAAEPCDTDFPDEAQVTHVTVNLAEEPAPWTPQSSVWLERSVVVGEVRVTVTYDGSSAELADQILESIDLA